MKKSQKVFNKVVALLRHDPKYRDDDSLLCCKIWWDSINPEMSAKDFLILYNKGVIITADYITRMRRKAEELHPELQGKTYELRQTHKVKKAKQEIREIV